MGKEGVGRRQGDRYGNANGERGERRREKMETLASVSKFMYKPLHTRLSRRRLNFSNTYTSTLTV